MKIRIGKFKIALSSLIRIEWRKYYPKLIIHEKFEKHVRWTLRVLTFLGILTSFLVLPYWVGIIVSLGLLGIQFLFEKVLFEYSVMMIQPFPEFEIDYNQWLTNGYLLSNEEIEGNEDFTNYFGPAYKDSEYAAKFFNYIRSWNQDSNSDDKNNICISFIYEGNVSYTTYIYASPKRKWLNEDFTQQKESMKLKKYGKNQQSLVAQMIYWKNLKMVKGMMFTKFIEQQKTREKFYFAPFVIEGSKLGVIDELKVLKMHFKAKGRSELNESEIEYHFK